MAGKASGTFSKEEKAAMKEAAAEAKRAKAKASAGEDLKACLDKIAGMAPEDKALAERVHEIVTTTAPDLYVRTWYGMPAYAKDGKVVCFFQDAGKFKVRYATLGFQDPAALDEGTFWPTSYALTAIDDDVAARIAELVKRAVG